MEEKRDLLENLPGLEPDTLAILNEAQITKVGQLLQLQKSADELGLLSCGVPLLELLESCKAAVSEFGARRQLDFQPNETISTSFSVLNEALDGGLVRGGITVFNGNSKCLTFVTQILAGQECTLIIVGGGSGARVSQFEGKKLLVPSVWKLVDCLDAVRDDAVAMQALGCFSSDVIIVDGISRLLAPALGIRSEARTKIRGTVCEISAALRSLATDSNCSVVIIAPEDACSSFDRMWVHVADARVEFISAKVRDENDTAVEGEDVSQPAPDPSQVRISRKNGASTIIPGDLESLLMSTVL